MSIVLETLGVPMSLYNLINGVSPVAPLVLEMLGGLPGSWYGRIRDAEFFVDDDGKFRLLIYTRNGGGNREHYDWGTGSTPDEDISCDCTGCIQTCRIPEHELYLRDFDDDFDCTYCSNVFRLPEEYGRAAAEIIGSKFESVDEALGALVSLAQSPEHVDGGPDSPASNELQNVLIKWTDMAIESSRKREFESQTSADACTGE